MTKNEHLLVCLAEECDEVGQNVAKALRFGLGSYHPADPRRATNAELIVRELVDLIGVAKILSRRGLIADFKITDEAIAFKEEKIERFMENSRASGALSYP